MAATAQRLKFGDFEFDQQSGELWRNGGRIVLPNQPFRILNFLINRPGVIVTRDELRRQLWLDDTFVDFEHSLNAGVKRLRDVLGDSATDPRFIETVPQRGYRFIGNIEHSPTITEPVDRWRGWPLFSAGTFIAVISILFAFRAFQPQGSTSDSPSKRRLVRLTWTAGLNADPSISLDGSLLAYASDRGYDGNFDIYVQAVAGGEPIRITNDAADESEPSFSPDGAHIVFSRRDAGLYVVGALGGEPRLIVRTPWARTPKFSPDGKWISYWTGFPASVVAGGIPGALGSVFIVSSDGSSPRGITTPLASARYPIWSPEGDHILFLGEENPDQKTHDWYIIPVNGGKAMKTGVVPALRTVGLHAPFPIPGTWISRTNAVVFATNETDNSNIWQIHISPRTYRATGSPERLTFGTAIERNPIVAAPGRIVFASIAEKVDIWRVPLDAISGKAAGALERITDDAGRDRLRSVSADGRIVFFISSRTKRDELWMKDLQTGRERQLTESGVDDASASPDGMKVAFSTSEAGKRSIEIMDIAGGLRSKLCDRCTSPAGWSPDGKRLLYAAVPFRRLFEYDFASNRQTELVANSTWSLERPRYSRDGRWITFHTANSPNVRQIYSAPIPINGPAAQHSWVPLVTDHGCHPSWSANGKQLYYFSFRDGAFCPWVQSVDPETNHPIGPPRAVFHLHHPGLRAASGAAAFNDVKAGYLYLTLTEATGNIWMIEPAASRGSE
jgi:Tol biopolymer transport system component/DNA-binding winged helix-turn-helix (wHTH) protein